MCFRAARGNRAGQLLARSGTYSELCRTRVPHHRLRPALQLPGVGQAAVHHQVRYLRWAVTMKEVQDHAQSAAVLSSGGAERPPCRRPRPSLSPPPHTHTSRKLDCSASCSMG